MDQKHEKDDLGAGQVMDHATHTMKTRYNHLNLEKSEAYNDKVHIEHLKPLSKYSRMITCGNKTSLDDSENFSNQFVNFKVEIVNLSSRKRRLDDSCLDDTYDTPAKRPNSPKAVSPDLGCVIDSCSPFPREDLVSPSVFSKLALINGTKATRSPNKEAVKSLLDLQHVECRPSVDSGGNEEKGPAPHGVLNLGPTFDFDVDDILCLSPIGIIPSPTPGHGVGEGDGKEEQRGEDLKKGTDDEEDDSYFSMSNRQALKAGKKPSQPKSPLLPQTSSCLLVRRVEGEVLEGEGDIAAPPEPDVGTQAAACQQYISLTADDCSLIVGSFVTVDAVEPLEGDIEDILTIGAPIFESSVCHSATVEPSAGEQGGLGGEEVEGGAVQPIREVSVDTSYETTLPLQVQVKSVVVVPDCQASSSKSAAPPQPQQKELKPSSPEKGISKATKCNRAAKSQRPVIFDMEEDWQREKRLYVHSVTRHMMETPSPGQDVMSELLNLMTHVADQGPGTNGVQWQHPSDVTRRNYQRRFGNMTPRISLNEWQAQNFRFHQRFAKFPKVFERSPLP